MGLRLLLLLVGLLLLRRESGYGMTVRSRTVAMARGVRVSSDGGVVMMWTNGDTTLHTREMGKPELLSPLEVVSPSLAESSRMVCSDGDPL
jgi:hypothetical protein